MAEQNNELLMKNHESRPTGATPFPETNVVFLNNINGRGRGRGRNRGRGRDRGKGRSNYTLRGNNHLDFKKTTNDDHRRKTPQNKKIKSGENQCFRCGMNGHWTRTRCTSNT